MEETDIFAECVREEPRVWVQRLTILENGDPNQNPIRDISFTRGFNIVWAEEPDGEDVDTEISGHSAGKTSLCRLIRYVLGEKHFSTKSNTRLIGKAFPEGYVGAELYVSGNKWAVIRPLKKGRNSYIKQNGTIEEVLTERSAPAFEHDYVEKIGLASLLDDLACGTIIETGQAIKWEHLLAWCTRDQEMRFQDIFGWRSPRSESEWPAFQHPKADPLFLMRVALGLFLRKELEQEESLGKAKQDRERLEKRIVELEKEPDFRVNLYDRELRHRLKALLPEEKAVESCPLNADDSLFPDLERLTGEAVKKIEEKISPIENDRLAAQDAIDESGGKIWELERKRITLDTVIALDSKAQAEIGGDPAERERIRKMLDEAANGMCVFGDVLFSECSYPLENARGL